MDGTWLIILGVLGVLRVLRVSIVIMYNVIITRMNRAKRAWSDVITYEKLKSDVIPELMQITDDFKVFETKFLEQITSMRSAISSISRDKIDIDKLKDIEMHSKAVFGQFRATAENYPELGSTEVVHDLLAEISDKNENVAAAITIYNRGVEQFNNAIEMLPLNIVNGLFTRKDKLEVFVHCGLVDDYKYKPNFS